MQPPTGYPGGPSRGFATYPSSFVYGSVSTPPVPPHLAADYSASLTTAVRRSISRGVRFRGLASRREFWFSYLAWMLMLGAMTALSGLTLLGHDALGPSRVLDVIALILNLALLVLIIGGPVCLAAVAVRRLHDVGRSGWWLLLLLIPFGDIVVLVLLCIRTRPWMWRPQWVTG